MSGCVGLKPPGTKEGALALRVVVLRGVEPWLAGPCPANLGPTDTGAVGWPAGGCCGGTGGPPGPIGIRPGTGGPWGGPIGPPNCCGCGGCDSGGPEAAMGPPWCACMPGIMGTRKCEGGPPMKIGPPGGGGAPPFGTMLAGGAGGIIMPMCGGYTGIIGMVPPGGPRPANCPGGPPPCGSICGGPPPDPGGGCCSSCSWGAIWPLLIASCWWCCICAMACACDGPGPSLEPGWRISCGCCALPPEDDGADPGGPIMAGWGWPTPGGSRTGEPPWLCCLCGLFKCGSGTGLGMRCSWPICPCCGPEKW